MPQEKTLPDQLIDILNKNIKIHEDDIDECEEKIRLMLKRIEKDREAILVSIKGIAEVETQIKLHQ